MLRTLCRMYDPDMVIMGVAIALFWPALVQVANTAGLALVATSVIVVIVKRAVARTRPAQEVQFMAPPDRFSFPSGHTLHAVSFTVIICSGIPVLALILVPMALLIAGSRVVLGLHYPTAVVAGGLIGALLAVLTTGLISF